VDVLSTLPTNWRPHFIDIGRALAPVDHYPNRYNRAIAHWAGTEPSLLGLRAETVFAEPRGGLTEAQARAMIRVARTTEPHAELAGWSVVWQFGIAIIGMARRQQHLPGNDGPRAAVCTATAEIWRLVQHIDLDANKASIFRAIASKARRAVIPQIHWIATIDRRTTLVDDPERAALHSFDRPGGDGLSSYEAVEWRLLTEQLVDPIVDEVVDRCRWDRHTRYFDARVRRLRTLVLWRIHESSTGEHQPLQAIAAELGDSLGAVKATQAALSHTMRDRSDHYRPLLTGW
jgi:hypothetical protein